MVERRENIKAHLWVEAIEMARQQARGNGVDRKTEGAGERERPREEER